jgi:hypothetical protein
MQMNLGVPDKHIQAILGHADVSTTRRIYEHSDLSNQRQALEKVERLLWPGGGSAGCRQSQDFQPSDGHIVDRITSFQSGATLGTRTPDPFLTMPSRASIHNRLTEVNNVLKVRTQRWKLGIVAVNCSRQNHGDSPSPP